jgi:hypothetical protein
MPKHKEHKGKKIFNVIATAAGVPSADQEKLYARFFTAKGEVTKTSAYEAVAAYFAEQRLGMDKFVRGSSASWDLEIKDKKGVRKWDVKTPMIPFNKVELISEYYTQEMLDDEVAAEEASSIARKQKDKGQIREDRRNISILLDTSYITPAIKNKILEILARDHGYDEAQLATIHELRY